MAAANETELAPNNRAKPLLWSVECGWWHPPAGKYSGKQETCKRWRKAQSLKANGGGGALRGSPPAKAVLWKQRTSKPSMGRPTPGFREPTSLHQIKGRTRRAGFSKSKEKTESLNSDQQ